MDAERQEEEIRDANQDLARSGEEMEHRLDQLEGDIEEAKEVSAQRQDAPEKAREPDGSEAEGDDAAGDWEGEASGAQQGEDAEDVVAQPTSEAEAQAEVEYELGDRGGEDTASGDDLEDRDDGEDGDGDGERGGGAQAAADPEARAEIEYELGDSDDEEPG